MPKEIYLDNSTTTRPSEMAISKMLPFYTERWGHPSSPHQKGQELFPAIAESLKSIYALLGAHEDDDFVFTSSGAEAVNHILFSAYCDITMDTGKNQFITSQIDEAPSIMAIGRLERFNCVGKMAAGNNHGKILAAAIADAMNPRTAMVSISWANGLTGVINPIQEISDLCLSRGVALHVDATHVLGKMYFDLHEINPTFLSFNGDHLHAPKGTGGFYIKSGAKCSPFIIGGIEQAGHRAGSYNIAGLAALGQAAVEALDSRDLLCTETARLRDKLEQGVLEGYPDATVLFSHEERLPHCSAIAFPGINNEAMLFALNRKGLYASIGGGSFQQISIVLKAVGVAEHLAHCSVAFSLSRQTTEEEIDRAIAIIVESAKKLRNISKGLI